MDMKKLVIFSLSLMAILVIALPAAAWFGGWGIQGFGFGYPFGSDWTAYGLGPGCCGLGYGGCGLYGC